MTANRNSLFPDRVFPILRLTADHREQSCPAVLDVVETRCLRGDASSSATVSPSGENAPALPTVVLKLNILTIPSLQQLLQRLTRSLLPVRLASSSPNHIFGILAREFASILGYLSSGFILKIVMINTRFQ